MHGALQVFLVEVAAAVVAAAILAVLNAVRRMGRSVRDTSAAADQLAKSVAILQKHDEDTRERLAALYGAWWRPQHHSPNGGHPPWT